MIQTIATFLYKNGQLSSEPRHQDCPIKALPLSCGSQWEPMGARALVSMLVCRRACSLYLSFGFGRVAQTHFTCKGRCALLHQNSSKMSNTCPVNQEVKKFKRGSLKKTEVQEKNTLPTTQVIEDEKIAIEEKSMKEPLNEELEHFKKTDKLKKTETKEKNPLPTTDVINEEKIALEEKSMKEPLNEELAHFEKTNKLKKTETKEKNSLPTAKEIEAEKKAQKQ